MLVMRVAVGLLAFLIAACENVGAEAPAPTISAGTASPVAEWEKWRAEENAAWAANEFAILKIDDAVYLNAGQSAWLTNRKQKVLQYAWTLDALSAPSAVRVTYAPPKALIASERKVETFGGLETRQVYHVADGVDVRIQEVQVEPGKNGLRVMVYNQANPVARAFEGLGHFSYNPADVVEATFEAAAKPQGVDFQTSRGWYKRFFKMGEAAFTLESKRMRLPMYAETDDPAKVTSLSAFFLDDLSGKETYGVGRYIDIDVKGLPTSLTLDFNRAYNPNCARSPHYNCPFAADKIPIALRAGEKIPPKH